MVNINVVFWAYFRTIGILNSDAAFEDRAGFAEAGGDVVEVLLLAAVFFAVSLLYC